MQRHWLSDGGAVLYGIVTGILVEWLARPLAGHVNGWLLLGAFLVICAGLIWSFGYFPRPNVAGNLWAAGLVASLAIWQFLIL